MAGEVGAGAGPGAMISWRVGGTRFQTRAAAVVLDDGWVLAHKAPADAFWSLPGGRVEVGEDAAATLRREMHEELGVAIACHRLLYVVEAFFVLAGERNHELGLYFLASLPAGTPLLRKDRVHLGIEARAALEFRWFECAALAGVDLRPGFLRAALARVGPGIEHVVHREPW